MSVNPEDLEATAVVDGEFVEEVEGGEDVDCIIDATELYAALRKATALLKSNAVLLEYLSDSSLVKTVTKRERAIMDRQISRVYALAEKIDETLDEAGDE